jgi:hypothetical protein
MRWRVAGFLAVVGGWFAQPAPALAGMPSVVLNDWAALRIETISFFLGVLLAPRPWSAGSGTTWSPIFPASHG